MHKWSWLVIGEKRRLPEFGKMAEADSVAEPWASQLPCEFARTCKRRLIGRRLQTGGRIDSVTAALYCFVSRIHLVVYALDCDSRFLTGTWQQVLSITTVAAWITSVQNYKGGCGTGSRAGRPLIGRSAVWSPALAPCQSVLGWDSERRIAPDGCSIIVRVFNVRWNISEHLGMKALPMSGQTARITAAAIGTWMRVSSRWMWCVRVCWRAL